MVRLGQEELIVGSQATIADETARRLGTTDRRESPMINSAFSRSQCFGYETSPLSLVLAAAAAVGAAAAANVAGLNPVRDVLLGVLFVLWIAWWISVLMVLHAKPIHLPPLPRHDAACAAPCW